MSYFKYAAVVNSSYFEYAAVVTSSDFDHAAVVTSQTNDVSMNATEAEVKMYEQYSSTIDYPVIVRQANFIEIQWLTKLNLKQITSLCLLLMPPLLR